MTPVNTQTAFAALYNLNDNAFFPSLAKRQTIPASLASSENRQQAVVGLGLVKAACAVLQSATAVGVQSDAISVYIGANGNYRRILGARNGTWYIEHIGYLAAVVGIIEVVTRHKTDRDFAEANERWHALIAALTQSSGMTPPYAKDQLITAAHDPAVADAMMALTDAMYFAFKRLDPQIVALRDDAPVPVTLHGMQQLVYASQPLSVAAPTPAAATVHSSTVHTLRRLIRRGATALLVGPTGAGKTHAAKQAVTSEHSRMVVVKGRPGLDDRQLYGGIYPQAAGYAWVDGPLAEAWRLAAQGERVVLVIDELARLDPYHLAALIGALDPVSGTEARAMGVAGCADDRLYYILALPTGEKLAAPCFTVIATTNLGSDYQQVQTSFDAALLRRFAVHVDIDRLDAASRRAILTAHGIPAHIASLLVEIEDVSVEQTAANGGLLQRELNLGTLMNWALEARSLVDDGLSWEAAVRVAANLTIVPFACPRLPDGAIEQPAAQVLRDEINTRFQ
jgi:MoxR-like ATPase